MIDKILYIGRENGCWACKQLHPIIRKKCTDNGITFIDSFLENQDVEDYAELYGIRGVPTVIAFKDDNETGRYTGTMTESEIDKFLEYGRCTS